jgi:hypothetical protein
MYDYGFQPKTLYNLLNETGIAPKNGDGYNALLSNKGNSYYNGSQSTNDFSDSSYDMRLYFWKFDSSSWAKCRFDDTNSPKWWRYNTVSNTKI